MNNLKKSDGALIGVPVGGHVLNNTEQSILSLFIALWFACDLYAGVASQQFNFMKGIHTKTAQPRAYAAHIVFRSVAIVLSLYHFIRVLW